MNWKLEQKESSKMQRKRMWEMKDNLRYMVGMQDIKK